MDSSDLRPEDDRERNATLNRIQDQQLCVRKVMEMENFQWQDVCREFESLLRLVDELVIQSGRLPPCYIKLLDDLDTQLRVTACDKKKSRAMSKLNAAAFQVLKVQVKTARDNHLRVIDECKEETAQKSKDNIVSDDSQEEVETSMDFLPTVWSCWVGWTSEQKRKNEREQRESGIASAVSAPPRSLQSHSRHGQLLVDRAQKFLLSPQQILGQKERRIASRPTAFCQAQTPRPSSRALSYVPRRLEDLPASERAAWCVLSPAEAMRF